MLNYLVVRLLGSLALVFAAQNLGLVVLNGLVNLGAARGLVAVHFGGQGGVVRAGDLLEGFFLAAAVVGVVLVFGGGEAVCDAALVLCVFLIVSGCSFVTHTQRERGEGARWVFWEERSGTRHT